MRRSAFLLTILSCSIVAAQPALEWTTDDLGSGLYAHTFTILGNDAQDRSFFANMTFEGVGGAEVQQMKVILIPGQVELDVDSDADALIYHGLGTPPYDMYRDSYFLEPFPSNTVALTQSINYYHIEAGTGTGNAYENAGLAYVCADGDVRFYGSISRGGLNYDISGDTAGGEGLGLWFTHSADDPDGDGTFDAGLGDEIDLDAGGSDYPDFTGYVVWKYETFVGAGGQELPYWSRILWVHDRDYVFVPEEPGRYRVTIWEPPLGEPLDPAWSMEIMVVPEPATLGLLALGAVGLLIRRR